MSIRPSNKRTKFFTIWEDECDRIDELDELVEVTGYELNTIEKLKRLASLRRQFLFPELDATSATFQDYLKFTFEEPQQYIKTSAYADSLIKQYLELTYQSDCLDDVCLPEGKGRKLSAGESERQSPKKARSNHRLGGGLRRTASHRRASQRRATLVNAVSFCLEQGSPECTGEG